MKYTEKKINNRRERGFTLVEFLVVIAIIAVLVFLAIPMFTMYLHSADADVDKANERNAKAVATYTVLGVNDDITPADGDLYYLDIDSGRLTTTLPPAYGKATEHEGQVVTVKFVKAESGYTYEIGWAEGASSE